MMVVMITTVYTYIYNNTNRQIEMASYDVEQKSYKHLCHVHIKYSNDDD